MLSLDKKILDSKSIVAGRMRKYGIKDHLYIIIPNKQKEDITLDQNVYVQATGGNRFVQFFRLILLAIKYIKKVQIDFITTQDPFFLGLVGVFLKFLSKTQLEVQFHGDFFGSDYYRKSGLKNLIQYYLAKFIVIKKADKIRVVGQRVEKSLVDMGIAKEKIEVRPILIDTERIKKYMPKFDLHDKYPGFSKIFLYLGRLEPVKNVGFLVDVFEEVLKKNKDFLLLIVGSGSLENNLKEKVRNLDLESNIKFEDWADDNISYFKTADCFLSPSLSEGYGLASMEAHIVGTKVIMNDVGVANYELPKSDNVIILPVDDVDAWIRAIKNI